MSDADAPRADRSNAEGAATAAHGTPVAVDVSGDPRARGTIVLFLAGPAIWTAHFLLVYLVTETGCTAETTGLDLFAPPVPAVLTLVATAVAAVACLATAGWAFRRWRRERDPRATSPGADAGHGGGTLVFAAFVLSLLGIIEVLFVGLPALVLPSC